MPLSVTCTCGLVSSVSSTRAGSLIACPCGRAVAVPETNRPTPPPVAAIGPVQPHEASTADDTIQTIKRMIRTRELPVHGTCPHSGKPGNDVVVFRLHFDPVAEEALAATEQASAASGGWSLFGLFSGKRGAAMAKRSPQSLGRDVWVDLPVRVAHEAHAEILLLRSQQHLRDMLRTVPIYTQLLAEHRTARIEALPRHSDGQPNHARH
ncbi:MAG: hypothetical protein RLZZ326_1209 [Planctomycetota bacterium]